MINLYLIITTILIFSITVISIILYTGLSAIFKRKDGEKFQKIDEGFVVTLQTHLELVKDNKEIEEEELKYINIMLKDSIAYEVFSSRIIEYLKIDKPYVVKYIKNYEDCIVKKFLEADKKSAVKFAYNIYLIGEFRISNENVNSILLESISSKSIYVRSNALKALSQIGDVNSFSKALKIISLSGIYFHQKIVIDAIDSFEGNEEDLNNILVKETKNFTEYMTNIVINHFQNTRYVGCRDFLVDILRKKDTSKDMVMRIIRYFHYIHYYKAENEIIKLFDSPNWEIRAVCAKAISRYNLDNCIDKVVRLVSDSNYNVRYNAAMTLISSSNNQKIVNDIINGKDKYARDIVIYALFTKKKITYEKYIGLLEEDGSIKRNA